MRWSVPAKIPALESLGTLIAVVAVAFGDDPLARLLGLAAGLLLGALTVRDLVARTRLAADAVGLTVVSGFAGHHTFRWSQLQAIRVDERTRLGLRSRLLELDSGDHLVLLSARELGADPQQVVSVLNGLRPQPGSSADPETADPDNTDPDRADRRLS